MATIYEVAAAAGVSPATVSRVFSGVPVSKDKTRRVRDAAEKLNFTPNRTARSLRRRNTEVIALIIPDIENPYYTEMARGVGDVAQEAGYSVVLCSTDENVENETRFLNVVASENVAGAVIAPASENTDIGVLIRGGSAVVAVDRVSHLDVDGVTMQNRAAGRSATEHLILSGYKRIACITGPAEVETALERAEGWKDAIRKATGSDPDEPLLEHSTYRVDGGRQAMTRLLGLADPPDAVVAANNLMGVGALQVLNERRLAPPIFGVAVVGRLPFTTMAPSDVTVVRLPARQMGITATRMLLERIGGDAQAPRTVVLRHVLEPATTGPALDVLENAEPAVSEQL